MLSAKTGFRRPKIEGHTLIQNELSEETHINCNGTFQLQGLLSFAEIERRSPSRPRHYESRRKHSPGGHARSISLSMVTRVSSS